MRLASTMPPSKLMPGIVWARAKATPSKVLWLSLRTITSQGRSLPEPGSAVRGRCLRTGGATVLMASIVRLVVFAHGGSTRQQSHPWPRRDDPAHPGVGVRVPRPSPDRSDELTTVPSPPTEGCKMSCFPYIESDFPACYAEV